jgi:hypothetical protein
LLPFLSPLSPPATELSRILGARLAELGLALSDLPELRQRHAERTCELELELDPDVHRAALDVGEVLGIRPGQLCKPATGEAEPRTGHPERHPERALELGHRGQR